MRQALAILWASFLAAGVAEILVFTFFDPAEFGMSRMAAYSAGFFVFWALAAASSTLTCFLAQGAGDINR
jgi:hypothetical protein